MEGVSYPLAPFELVQNETEDPEISVTTDIVPGASTSITLTGFTPGEVVITLDIVELGSLTVGDDGSVTGSIAIPGDLAPGAQELVATHSNPEVNESATYSFTYEAPAIVQPQLSLTPSADVQIGDTIQLTVDNLDALIAEYGEDYALTVQGGLRGTTGSYGAFGDDGIQQLEDSGNQYEYTIPTSVVTADEGKLAVEEGSQFSFWATFTANPDNVNESVSYRSADVFIDIIAGATPAETETPEPEVDLEEPGLTVEPTEILLDDFIGDPEDDETGVLHKVVGAAPDSTVEYSVDTPDTVAPFNESDEANEDGLLEFWIHGYETSNPSVYLGEYTTTVTFEDADGEAQELSASFTVVDGSEDDDIAPVVDIEEPADDEDDAPALSSADALAETGASGPQLAWIAAGLLALGGGLVLFANRARLFGRKN